MAINGLALLEMEAVYNSMIIGIPFVNVRVPGGQMRGDEAKAGIE